MRTGDHREQLICYGGDWRRSVQGDGSQLQHLHFKNRTAIPDLLSAGFVTPGWIGRIIGKQPLLLRLCIDAEQENPVEQVGDLVDVERDAADQHRHLAFAHNLLEPRAAPDPVVYPEPLLIGLGRTIGFEGLCARIVLPVREFRVIVGIDRDKPTTDKLSRESGLS